MAVAGRQYHWVREDCCGGAVRNIAQVLILLRSLDPPLLTSTPSPVRYGPS